MKISEIISKEIISIYECESVGTIKNVCFNKDLTKVLGFIFFNDESDYESYIPVKNIYSISEEGLMIRNTNKIDFFISENNNPINKKIFEINGKDTGRICDIEFDEKFNVCHLLTNKNIQIKPQNILSNGVGIILVKDDNQKISINAFKPKKQKIEKLNQDFKVKIVKMPIISNQEKNISALPPKITTNTSTLVGKRAKRTIFGFNNEVIIKENALVSNHTLTMAKKHNKTNELIFNVLDWWIIKIFLLKLKAWNKTLFQLL